MRAWMVMALVLLLPGAAAQASVPTSLFVHLISVQDAPINTQEPPQGWSTDASWGTTAMTMRCLHGTTGDIAGTGFGTAGSTSQEFATWRGFGSPRLVDYLNASGAGTPRTSPDRGLFGDVRIDPAASMALHWFMKPTAGTDGSAGGIDVPDTEAPAFVTPNVLVRATIRTGDAISVDDKAYDTGRLLFSGQAGPATLANGEVLSDGAVGTVQAVGQHDGEWVYEFIVPLQAADAAADAVIPMTEGYNLRVDVLMDNPVCEDPDATIMPGMVAMHSSPGLRPRIAWSVVDPLSVGDLRLHLDGEGRVFIDVGTGTVFGSDDVKDLEARLERVARDGSRTEIPLSVAMVAGYGPCGHDCGHTTERVYSVEDPHLAPGHYELTVTYSNLQGTAQRSMSASLVVQPSAESPGTGFLVLLALLAGLAVAARRR